MLRNDPEVAHVSLADQIVKVIEQDILNGRYAPGQRITETELSTRFKVSRSPLREALQTLEDEGFLVSEPYKGMRVAQVNPDDAWDIFVIRANLESLAMRLAIERQDRQALHRLKELHEQMQEAAAQNDIPLYHELNSLFHQTFHEACGNERLAKMLERFNKQTFRYRQEYFKTKDQIQRSLESHATMISFFENKEPDRAEQYRKERLLYNAELLIANMREK